MLLPVTGQAGGQRCAGPVTCCCYQSAAPRWKRLSTEFLQVMNLTTAKSAPRIAPQQRTDQRFSVRIRSMTWVELRGLEPLASCMPWEMRQFNCRQVPATSDQCRSNRAGHAEDNGQMTVKTILNSDGSHWGCAPVDGPATGS